MQHRLYALFVLLGTAHLLPFNAFIALHDYYQTRFPTLHMDFAFNSAYHYPRCVHAASAAAAAAAAAMWE